MINVGVFTEGFDCPDIRSIFMARPTASENLYLQMIGRGTRITDTKDGFYVVDFVDELGKYSLLANRWAVQHLGAEDEEEKLQLAADCERALDALRRRGVDPQLIREVEKEFVLFSGFLEYKGNFDKQPISMAVTNELYLAWLKLQAMFEVGNKAKDIIEGMYAWADVGGTGMELRQWKSLGWATFFDKIGQKHKGWVKFLQFRKVEFEKDQLRNEVQEAISRHSTVNERMESPYERDQLQAQINEYLFRHASIPAFVSELSYRNQILTVKTLIYRNNLKGGDRAIIRDLLKEYASELMDMDLELVLHWAK
jgi:hypothetical protein